MVCQPGIKEDLGPKGTRCTLTTASFETSIGTEADKLYWEMNDYAFTRFNQEAVPNGVFQPKKSNEYFCRSLGHSTCVCVGSNLTFLLLASKSTCKNSGLEK